MATNKIKLKEILKKNKYNQFKVSTTIHKDKKSLNKGIMSFQDYNGNTTTLKVNFSDEKIQKYIMNTLKDETINNIKEIKNPVLQDVTNYFKNFEKGLSTRNSKYNTEEICLLLNKLYKNMLDNGIIKEDSLSARRMLFNLTEEELNKNLDNYLGVPFDSPF